MFVEGYLGRAHPRELVTQQAKEVELLRGGGLGRGVRVALGVDDDVAEEAL